MRASIDIENSKTKKVITLNVDVIKNESDMIIFDISNLSSSDYKILSDAVNEELTYTDIEMFFIDYCEIPYFGPDYDYVIDKDTLTLIYKTKKHIEKVEEKNNDWTLQYNEEFNKIALDFLNTEYDYLLVYYLDKIKYEFLNGDIPISIFSELFYNKGYKKIALFKRGKEVISNNVRDKIIYIDSYDDEEE